MSKKTLHSFTELGMIFGVKPREKKPKKYVCQKCGKALTRINGTNVCVCRNQKDGKVYGFRYIIPERV